MFFRQSPIIRMADSFLPTIPIEIVDEKQRLTYRV